MGQKIHPTGYRVGIIEPWASRWHGHKRDFARLLYQDKQIRDHVAKEYGSAGIPRIEIERTDLLRQRCLLGRVECLVEMKQVFLPVGYESLSKCRDICHRHVL